MSKYDIMLLKHRRENDLYIMTAVWMNAEYCQFSRVYALWGEFQ